MKIEPIIFFKFPKRAASYIFHLTKIKLYFFGWVMILNITASGQTPFYTQGNILSSTDIFGSTNNVGVSIFTNNMQRVHITNNGKFGIGTSTPSAKLEVFGDAIFGSGTLTYPSTPTGDGITIRKNDISRIVMNDGTANFNLYFNSYFDKNSNSHKYIRNSEANRMTMSKGSFNFYVASFGNANSSISWINALTIDSVGNIGIGENTPAQKLHLVGNQTIQGNFIEIGASLKGNRNAYIDFVGDDSLTDYGLRIIRSKLGNSEVFHRGNGILFINSQDNGDIRLRNNGKDRVVVNGITGYVGLGTTIPNFELSINSDSSDVVSLQLTEKNSGKNSNDGYVILGTKSNMWFQNKEGGSFTFSGGDADRGFKQSIYLTYNTKTMDYKGYDFALGKGDGRNQGVLKSNRALTHSVNGLDNLVINNSGDFEDGVRIQGPKTIVDNKMGIGIDTIPAGFLLAVKGNIIAEEVRDRLHAKGWPDYVFETNYKMPSLSETNEYIEKNKHLPGVPSAKEIEGNGFGLAEMDAILLKKIEELTLHTIKQQELIEKLENEVREIKNK